MILNFYSKNKNIDFKKIYIFKSDRHLKRKVYIYL